MTRLSIYAAVAGVLGIVLVAFPDRVRGLYSSFQGASVLAFRVLGLVLVVISAFIFLTLGQVAP